MRDTPCAVPDRFHVFNTRALLLMLAAAVAPGGAFAALCEAHSGAQRTPVIELYTSEGCSSCPPADRWLSTLKGKPVVAEAFHVSYWDNLGWVDRFAAPAYTQRQEELSRLNQLHEIYTPQVIRDGKDWTQWRTGSLVDKAPAGAAIAMQQGAQPNQYSARVTPMDAATPWSAYWSVTEHGYSSHVRDGENKGAFLQHDFVVRQYVPVGRYRGAQTLSFAGLAPQEGHAQQVNLVVSDARTGETLQALSLQCH